MMSDPMLERIQREAGIPELIDTLVERLAPTDLQSLLLEVYRRRVVGVHPSQLLERYEQDRFVRPSELAPGVLAEFDRLAWSLLPDHYTAVELSFSRSNAPHAGVFSYILTLGIVNGYDYVRHTAWYADRPTRSLQACSLTFVSSDCA